MITIALCDEMGDLPASIEWIVYHYEGGMYDGDGVALYKENGKYYTSGLGHCSCYGPEERLGDGGGDSFDTLEAALKSLIPYSDKDYDIVPNTAIIDWFNNNSGQLS